MARPLRLEFPGAVWHITSRGNDQRDIVRDDEDRMRFLNLFAEAVARYNWIVYDWMLMTNHYHLVIETPEPTLSRGMQWFNSCYAQSFNRRHKRKGHLFEGRFHGVLVDSEEYLLRLSRYVAFNPVRAGMAGRVDQYRWSSYHAIAGLPSPAPAILANGASKILHYFHPTDPAAARAHYRAFMDVPCESVPNPWTELRGQQYLGRESWIAEIQDRIDAKPRSKDHPRVQRHLCRPSMEQIVAAVAETSDVTPDGIAKGRGGRSRMLVAYLGLYDGVHLQREIADALNLASVTRVSALVSACRTAITSDGELAALASDARKRLEHCATTSVRVPRNAVTLTAGESAADHLA